MSLLINPEEYNNTCYIVAGGPSLKGFAWSRLDGKFVIAINRSYEVLPNAQIIYFTDYDFWDHHRDNMLAHSGQLIKGSQTRSKEENNPSVIYYRLSGKPGISTERGLLHHGNNSTYAALNLAAVHLKFKKIYLFGVDMKWGEPKNKSTSHWHDGHKRIDPEYSYDKMKRAFKTIVEPLTNIGVEVYNANIDSALECFPKVTIEEALNEITDEDTRHAEN